MKRILHRTIFVLMALVLGLTALPASYAQRSFLTDTNALMLDESFDDATLPTGWQVTGAPGWRFDNPLGRSNETGGAGNMAIADSDYEGHVSMDTALITPPLDLSAAPSVELRFKTDFYSCCGSTAGVDVSVDGGATWTSVWSKTDVDYLGTVTRSVPQAAGEGNVLFRFRYYDAYYAYYWMVDDVQIETPSAPAAPDSLTATVNGSNIDLAWADMSDNEANFIVERSPDGASGWVEAARVGSNVTAFTHQDVECGDTVFYRVKATNGALHSGYSNLANTTMTACPSTNTGIDENFDAAQSLPAGWTEESGYWYFDETNTTGGTGNAAYGYDGKLRTPVFNMIGADAVLMTFKTDLVILTGQSTPQNVNIDISRDGGAAWTTVWDKTAGYKGAVSIDLSEWAANRNNLMVRFVADLPFDGTYWQFDDVEIAAMPIPNSPTGLTATLSGFSDVILGWSGSDGAKYKIERSADSGATWTQVADLGDGATSYLDDGVLGLTPYQYRVRAYNAAGQSAYSSVANITTGDKSVRDIDVTISLYAGAPIGTAADRAKYEAIIGYFADSLYEATNGANRLRKVTFYRDAKNFDSAHVQWIENCWPCALTGGYIRPGTGANIEMCDTFDGKSFLNTVEGQMDAGFSLTHEWGHFFYGLRDEYQGSDISDRIGSPQATDPGTSITIMNDFTKGWSDSDYRYLNFSTPALGFTAESAQGRVFGADAWTVLSRPKNQDPQNSYAQVRPYWPELAAAAPASGQTDIELPDASARAVLQIVWEPGFTTRSTSGPNAVLAAANNVIREIVIDRSALMADSGYLDDVKSAIADLIDQSATGDTLGIIAFDGTVTEIQPLTDIVDQTTKDTLIAALNGIAAGGADVAGGDALQAALTALTAVSVPADTTRVVYFITAGGNTTGVNPTTVIPGYQTAGIPLHIFGFDPVTSAEANLRLLAELTEGQYAMVQDVAGLRKALRLSEQDTSPTQDVILAYYDEYVSGGVPYSYTVAVDETLNEIDFEFTYYGEALSATITLEDPDGYDWPIEPATDCDTYGSGTADVETTCYFGFLGDLVGDWTVSVEAPEDIFVVDYETGVAAAGQTTYNAVVNARDGNVTDYPQPIVVEASVTRGYPIGGLYATGRVYEPDGTVLDVDFRDDGVAPDLIEDDGIYSAYVDYTQDDKHWVTVHFDNYDGNGFYTNGALEYLGSLQITKPITLPLVTESFERYAEVQVMVKGWQEDDHADWPDDPNWPATVLTLDNTQVHGRIDFTDDVDMFEITVPSDYAKTTLGVRINRLGLGMDPYVYLYAEDYSWEFERYLEFVATADDALFIPIDVVPGETFFVEVWHYEEDETGTYNISAGPYLWSDPIAKTKAVSVKVFLPIISKQ